jgi:hypothetical protein
VPDSEPGAENLSQAAKRCAHVPMTWTLYRHRKGMHYLCLGHVLHSEDCSEMTLYRCLYENTLGKTWVRPRAMFEDTLPDGQKRFTPAARLRLVEPGDESPLWLFAHHVPGEEGSRPDFIAGDALHKQYHLRGTRYVLENLEGVPLCNLSTLRLARGLVGIASLATAPEHRGKGYTEQLLRAVMELSRFQSEGEPSGLRFLLFSEVPRRLYESCGFQILPEEHQRFEPSIAMATGELPLSPQEAAVLKNYF